ncbi:MAG: hypothetical protein GY903_21535 [Fuerstiella sp.]|nr:hypothetical protein [Fuerstiella sp.]MCP4857074.1 hypothetical protein [Fuerstiella sp.]
MTRSEHSPLLHNQMTEAAQTRGGSAEWPVSVDEHTAYCLQIMTQMLMIHEKPALALEVMQLTLDLSQQLVLRDPENRKYNHRLRYFSHLNALLCLEHDEVLAYREICATIQQQLDGLDNPMVGGDGDISAYWCVMTCSLAPDAVEDYAATLKLARQAVENKSGAPLPLKWLGAILMRSGQYDQAKAELEKALTVTESKTSSKSDTHYFLAMTEHHLGHEQAAREQLETANQSAELELANDETRWYRRATLELLRDETTELLGDAGNKATTTLTVP